LSSASEPRKKAGHTVARAGIIVMASIMLSRVLGLVRDAVIASQFGTTVLTDAYTISFRVPDLIFYLVAGGAFSSALIPVFSEYLSKDDEDGAWKTFSVVATIMGTLVVLLVTAMFLAADAITPILAVDKPKEIFDEVTLMGRILLPAQIFFLFGSLSFATLYSKKEFTVPGLGPNLYNICIILGAIFISHWVNPSVAGMCWGALIGAFLGNVLVPLWAMRRVGMKFSFSYDFRHPGALKVFKLMLPVIFGLSLPQVLAFFNNWLSNHYGAGTNTAMDYANKLQQAPIAIFGMSMALAAFPTLSEFWAKSELKLFTAQFTRTLTTTAYLCLPIAAMMIAVPDEIIRIVFERNNFTAASTALTAPLLQALAVGILGWSLAPVVMRGFYATQQTIVPIVIGTGATVIFIGGGLTVKYSGQPAFVLALVGSITGILLVGALLVALKKRVSDLEFGPILTSLFKTILASAVFGAIMWVGVFGFHQLGEPGGFVGRLLSFSLCFIIAGWGYYLASKVLKMPEAATIERAASRLNRGKKNEPESTDEAGS
jgi:putative peptidoglycan lipid II flippase